MRLRFRPKVLDQVLRRQGDVVHVDQRLDARHGSFELTDAAVEMVRQPFEERLLEVHLSSLSEFSQRQEPAGRRQRFHADDQARGEAAGQTARQMSEQSRPHVRGQHKRLFASGSDRRIGRKPAPCESRGAARPPRRLKSASLAASRSSRAVLGPAEGSGRTIISKS